MLSYYFQKKTQTHEFKENLNNLIKELYGKNILLYGVGEAFTELNKKYDLLKNFNVRLISDKKFEGSKNKEFMKIKAVSPSEIKNENFDMILVTVENSNDIINYLEQGLEIDSNRIRALFNFEFKEERQNLIYLNKFNFEKTLPKLIKTLKNKRVLIYGAGEFFKLIHKFYDLSGLNIIGISDKRFENHLKDEELFGYKVFAPDEIKHENPDVVLVATKYYVDIIEELYYKLLRKTKIKVKPLVKKPFFTLIKEVWGRN